MARQRRRSVHGGGSIFQRKADGRWVAKFKIEETGKYKSLYADTEKDAYKLLEDAKMQQRQGTLPTGPQQTVEHFLVYWLEDVEKPMVRTSTYIGNRIVIHKHLIPAIGYIKLQKLTASQLQSFYAGKLKEGMATSRVVRFNSVLHKALNHAKRLKLVGTNVSEDVELPRIQPYQVHVLEADQARLLLQKAAERKLDALLGLAVVTAMRKGEILGLCWSDLDMSNGLLRISRTVHYYTGHGFVEGKPKTKRSERTITLPTFLIEMLKKHRALQYEIRLRSGADWMNRNLVFCGKNGDFMRAGTLLYHFNKLLEDAELPHIRFHDLRHSAATILLSMGVSPHVVQELLGHENIATTLGTYGHVLPSMRHDSVDKMDGLYGQQL